jgi:hypothetical protein
MSQIARIKLRVSFGEFLYLGRPPTLNNHLEKQVAKGYGGAPRKDQDTQIHQNGLDQVHN